MPRWSGRSTADTAGVAGHRQQMKSMFIGGCVLAGVFSLLPGRFLGNLLWKHTLGVIT